MQVTDELIDYLCGLARLPINEEEREAEKQEISKIIDYMDMLNEVDTKEIEAMSHAFPIKNVFRLDEGAESAARDDVLLNAPHQKDGCFQVPKTVGSVN